jgi:hypothetical protein
VRLGAAADTAGDRHARPRGLDHVHDRRLRVGAHGLVAWIRRPHARRGGRRGARRQPRPACRGRPPRCRRGACPGVGGRRVADPRRRCHGGPPPPELHRPAHSRCRGSGAEHAGVDLRPVARHGMGSRSLGTYPQRRLGLVGRRRGRRVRGGRARQSIAARTARTWFALIEARQQLRLAEETVGTYRTTTDQVRDRYERGLRPSIDLRLMLANLHTAEALEAQRREQYGRVLRQFELLLGRYPAGALETPDALPALPGDVPVGLPADLLAQRPDLRAAERRIAAADARLVASRRALYPASRSRAAPGLPPTRCDGCSTATSRSGAWPAASRSRSSRVDACVPVSRLPMPSPARHSSRTRASRSPRSPRSSRPSTPRSICASARR